MTIPVHLASSWLFADAVGTTRRERVAVTLAGVAPDLDGVGLIADFATKTTNYYGEWHHVYGHNVWVALAAAAACGLVFKRRFVGAASGFAVVHLHLLCDLISGKGPQGHIWGVQYLFPLSDHDFLWSDQWYLNDWKNFVVAGALVAALVFVARRKHRSPVEILSPRADEKVLASFRSVFSQRKN